MRETQKIIQNFILKITKKPYLSDGADVFTRIRKRSTIRITMRRAIERNMYKEVEPMFRKLFFYWYPNMLKYSFRGRSLASSKSRIESYI